MSAYCLPQVPMAAQQAQEPSDSEKKETQSGRCWISYMESHQREPELRQCDVWELKPRHRSGECWADFSSMFQPPYFSSPQPKFDDLGTNLPLSISLYSFSSIYFLHYLFLFVSFPTYFIHRETLLKKPMVIHAHIFLF